ncbi:hypothetical protein H8356DRAFT_1429961 [Neocallimastix lanati (nom. inval.)]|nr:hypothetical protein H8356DRAFT_1429961 [Neocallimastix sp. JGI-2020a]
MVIKPMNFQSPPNYSDPTFYLGMNAIPKVSSYIYLVRKSLPSFTLPGVLITAFCDSDDNRWLSFLKWTSKSEPDAIVKWKYRRLIHSKACLYKSNRISETQNSLWKRYFTGVLAAIEHLLATQEFIHYKCKKKFNDNILSVKRNTKFNDSFFRIKVYAPNFNHEKFKKVFENALSGKIISSNLTFDDDLFCGSGKMDITTTNLFLKTVGSLKEEKNSLYYYVIKVRNFASKLLINNNGFFLNNHQKLSERIWVIKQKYFISFYNLNQYLSFIKKLLRLSAPHHLKPNIKTK